MNSRPPKLQISNSQSELEIEFSPPPPDAQQPIRVVTFISAVKLSWDLMFELHEYYERQKIYARYIIINRDVHLTDYVKQGPNVISPVGIDDIVKLLTIENTFNDLMRDKDMMCAVGVSCFPLCIFEQNIL